MAERSGTPCENWSPKPESPKPVRARAIAFYLPQFHPIPENDEWWGAGFTEWTNVTRARPLFRGHEQPRLPADLGFYDLRIPETRQAQADLARRHGIEGFCYWHYWFHGRRLLGRPIDDVLASGEPDFPFCLGWVNESWSRTWMGESRVNLIEQTYSEQDDLDHTRWLAEAFADPRYIRVHGRPLFLVYRPKSLPDPRRTVETIRRETERLGLPNPYLVGIAAPGLVADMRSLGFDLTELHEPQLHRQFHLLQDQGGWARLRNNLEHGVLNRRLRIYDYRKMAHQSFESRPDFPHFPCVFAGFDNSARRGQDGIIMTGATPDAFREILQRFVDSVADRPAEERIVFINAWNEWAEGMYLEPDQKYGHGFLQAVASIIHPFRGTTLASKPITAPTIL